MLDLVYDWERFWYPKGKEYNCDYAGYLENPRSTYAYIPNPNPDVVPFENISENPCLVLLGEPGMGKSFAIKQASEQLEKKGKANLYRELKGSNLCDYIFGSQEFQKWLGGSYQLDLFLDSLDEGLLSDRNFSDDLIRKLSNSPCERLRLRITCRTADWRNTLENELKQLWGEDKIAVYELAPLRQIDVKKAAEINNLDSAVFLSEIQDKDAAPLAIQPITLKFLLGIYLEDGQFPSTKKELYEKGILKLCDENNRRRRESNHKGKLDTDERMMIAARIAAVTVFSSPVAVYNGSGNTPKKAIAISDLCGTETIEEYEFRVTESNVDEVLAITGLFSSYGDGYNCFTFAHQTYAEFLAAWYLANHQMTLAQRMSLLQHPNDPDKKLVPQLHEVAAWLASFDSDVFLEIIATDPDVMLHSDVAIADRENCAALVENLLNLYNQGKLLYENRSWSYQRLNPTDLADKLKPYIKDINKSIDARYVAIDIARACQIKLLQDDLVTIALDSSQPHLVRVNAAHAVSDIGDPEIKAKLKPLALGNAGADPDNELKGYGLHAVYSSSHISTTEIFDILTKPTGNFFGGTYQDFVARELTKHLKPDDLPVALKWLESQDSRHNLRYPFDNLSDAIMLLAWEYLESPHILELFAKVVFKWRRYQEIIDEQNEPSFRDILLNNDIKRRLLLEKLVCMIAISEGKALYLLLGDRTQIILQKDFFWMIGQVQSSRSENIQKVWAQLIKIIFRSPESSPEKANTILSQTNKILCEEFKLWLGEIAIDSPEAENLRTAYLEEIQWSKQDKYELKPSVTDRINSCLAEIELGNLIAWLTLNWQMTLMPYSKHYDAITRKLDLTSLNAWQTIDESTRLRIIEASKQFIVKWQRESKGLSDLYDIDVAAYKALRLLLSQDPNFILNLSTETWKMWTPVIINIYSLSSDSRYVQPHLDLTKLAFEKAPDEFITALIDRIDEENKEHGHIFIIDSIRTFWDKRIEIALLDKLEDVSLKAESLRDLLEALLSHKVLAAKKFAESLITLPPPSSGEQRARAIAASSALIRYVEDAGWSVVWEAIQQEPEFGKEVIESISYFARDTGSLEWRLQERQILDLYMWLAKYYPPTEKTNPTKDKTVNSWLQDRTTSPEEGVVKWQSTILQHLKERGTLEAFNVLQQIANHSPEMPENLKRNLLEAQLKIRRSTWMPPTPQEVLQVTRDENIRLVNSGEQLLDVIVESLDRLNQEFKGETPSAFFLWNEDVFSLESNKKEQSGQKNTQVKTVFRPKDEQALSDYVKLHLVKDLKQRAIIANREVEISRRHGDKKATSGKRVDILVNAFVRQPNREIYDPIKVIIEVKGGWNESLNNAMKTQLVDAYLENVTQYGVYLIGWFNCEQWDRKDYRYKKHPKRLDIDKAKKKFALQAADLSKQGLKIKAVVLDTSLRSQPNKSPSI
jgi:predicted NACHT family NTPase